MRAGTQYDSEGKWEGFTRENSMWAALIFNRKCLIVSRVKHQPSTSSAYLYEIIAGFYLAAITLICQTKYCAKGTCTTDITDPSVYCRLMKIRRGLLVKGSDWMNSQKGVLWCTEFWAAVLWQRWWWWKFCAEADDKSRVHRNSFTSSPSHFSSVV